MTRSNLRKEMVYFSSKIKVMVLFVIAGKWRQDLKTGSHNTPQIRSLDVNACILAG